MAFHAEEADDVAAVLRYAPAAARRATALYVDLADELLLLDRIEEAAEAIGRGLELWRAVGDRRSEGDATRRLSSVL